MADTVVATDSFNRADGDVGANWTKGAYQAFSGRMKVVGQKASPVVDETLSETWNGAGTFTTDQYAEVILSGFGGYGASYYAGLTLRFSGSGATANGYGVMIADNLPSKTASVLKVVNGSRFWTDLSLPPAFASGDKLRAEITGSNPTTIKVYRNGVLFAIHTDSSSPHLAGKPGMGGRAAGTFIDDWVGGNLSSAVRKLRIICDPRIAGATAIAGTVSTYPTGGNFTGTELGKFTGKTAASTLLAGKAYFDVPASEVGASGLTLSDTPVVGWRAITSPTSTLGSSVAVASVGVHTAVIVEE